MRPRISALTFGGTRDPRQDFQQRALARAVAPDQPHHFAFFYLEAHVLQRPDKGRVAVGWARRITNGIATPVEA